MSTIERTNCTLCNVKLLDRVILRGIVHGESEPVDFGDYCCACAKEMYAGWLDKYKEQYNKLRNEGGENSNGV